MLYHQFSFAWLNNRHNNDITTATTITNMGCICCCTFQAIKLLKKGSLNQRHSVTASNVVIKMNKFFFLKLSETSNTVHLSPQRMDAMQRNFQCISKWNDNRFLLFLSLEFEIYCTSESGWWPRWIIKIYHFIICND